MYQLYIRITWYAHSRDILVHWNPLPLLIGPITIPYFPPFLVVRGGGITEFSLKEWEQKGKSMPLLVWPIIAFHTCSSMLFLLPSGGSKYQWNHSVWGARDGKSWLLSDCMKRSLPINLTRSHFCGQEINFYCVNLLMFWKLLFTTAYLTVTNTEKNTVSWSVLQTS